MVGWKMKRAIRSIMSRLIQLDDQLDVVGLTTATIIGMSGLGLSLWSWYQLEAPRNFIFPDSVPDDFYLMVIFVGIIIAFVPFLWVAKKHFDAQE